MCVETRFIASKNRADETRNTYVSAPKRYCVFAVQIWIQNTVDWFKSNKPLVG